MERAPDYVERDLFVRVLVVFIEGARAFKHKKCSLERKVFAEGMWEGVKCVGRREVGGKE